MFWNKKLFKQAGLDASRRRRWTNSWRTPKKISAAGRANTATACAAARAASTAGMMFMADRRTARTTFFNEDGTSTFNEPGCGQGPAVAGRHVQEGLRAEGQRELGLQRDRRRLLFRHLRHARPGSGRADRHRRADEARRTSRVAPMPLGPAGKAFPTIGYAGWAMFAASQHKDDAWKLIAPLSVAREQSRLGEVRRRAPDPQGRRAGPVLRDRAVQGLVHRAERPALGCRP